MVDKFFRKGKPPLSMTQLHCAKHAVSSHPQNLGFGAFNTCRNRSNGGEGLWIDEKPVDQEYI